MASLETLRIQGSLYPFVLFSLWNESLDPTVVGIAQKTWKRRERVYSLIEEADKAVCWDPHRRKVEVLPIASLDYAHSNGFAFSRVDSAVKFYEQGRVHLPSIQKPWNVPFWVSTFNQLLKTQSVLGVKNWEQCSESELLLKVSTTLCAAVYGLNGLGYLDPFSRQFLEHIPDGVIQIEIGEGVGWLGSIQIINGQLSWIRKEQKQIGRKVDFRFKNLMTAWKSVANLTDNLAAVGKGDIHLRGYIPLADSFNHMLDRLQIFVKT